MYYGHPTFDERDEQILAERQAAFDEREGPRTGDYVVFADGVERRISYRWPDGYQTSDGGSWYLGSNYMSFSGSLHGTVPPDSVTPTGETRTARAWFFHHDRACRDNGVDVQVRVRVFRCSLPAPR